MDNQRLAVWREARTTMIGLIASSLNCPMGLYELQRGQVAHEIHTTGIYEPYCRKVQSYPEGAYRCRQYHSEQALQAAATHTAALTVCPAGVFNQTLPILVGGEVKAVLSYGQMSVPQDERQADARRSHQELLGHLWHRDTSELPGLYRQIKQLTPAQLTELNQKLTSLQQWLYRIYDEELRLDRYTESVVHEVAIQLQAVLAQAESLRKAIHKTTDPPTSELLGTKATDLVGVIKAMRTAIWNAGDYLPAYKFAYHKLDDIVEESIALYRSMAEGKGAPFRVHLRTPTVVFISRMHFQHALNNLVHNAVKYSFSGNGERDRFIEISGRPFGSDYYDLEICNFGVGVEPDEFERVFEPGYEGVQTRVEHREGTGMGLTVAREIILQHDGEICLESRHQGGDAYLTKVSVRIPSR
jgi:signal transduction histidine kinase